MPTNGTVEHGTLLRETLRLLKNRPITLTLRRISEDTTLPEGWLLSISSHPNLSPSVDRVQKLYEYLKGQPLAL